jgi:Tfp pilus assembly protein PilF
MPAEVMNVEASPPSLTRYRAFISYSHADEKLAARLHRKLENYRLPRSLRQQQKFAADPGSARLKPVFRDRDELSSSASLGDAILHALDQSAALIVVCSPDAVASRWVNEEIRSFRSRHPQRPVFAFVVAGDPGADPRTVAEKAALPLQLLLRDVAQPGGELGEPLAADARREGDGFGLAFLKLAAGLLGVPFDQLRQREVRRRQKQWMFVSIASLLLMTVFAVLAWRATVARNEAQVARAQAELELISERETRAFLLSVFQLADPGEARGHSVTVREVLDSAVARIDSTPFSRPVIKARFLATMGQAYSQLGLNRRGIGLLSESIAALPPDSDNPEDRQQSTDNRIELADIHFDMGDYVASIAELERLDNTVISALQRARANNIRGDVLAYQQQDTAAAAAYQQALQDLDSAATGNGNLASAEELASIRGRSLGGMGLLSLFAGDAAQAEELYRQVIGILLPALGEAHPDSIWAMVSWGSAAYANQDLETAREAWERVLRTAERVLGTGNTEVATIKSNLGRLELETGNYLVAESLLADALRIDREHRAEDFDDLSFTLYNLALARWSLDQPAEASLLLEVGQRIASKSGHRMLGPILLAQAELACSGAQAEVGFDLASQGLEQVRQHHGESDWRFDQALLVQAYCRASPQSPVTDEVAHDAACRLMHRWPDDGWFHQQALRLGAAVKPVANFESCGS